MSLRAAAFERGLFPISRYSLAENSMGQCKAVADLTLGEVWRGDVRAGFDAATSRILAYWTDECARDLDKLMTHFASDAEVITPDGRYRGHDAVAALYQKSFDSYPGLGVD